MKQPIPEFVFTQATFGNEFSKDMNTACGFIFLESGYITVEGVKRFAAVISAAIDRGVRVCVFVEEPEDWALRDDPSLDNTMRAVLKKTQIAVDYMLSLGAHVTLSEGNHLKLAVIDYKITWGGSLNILSYTSRRDEEVWRWAEREWALDTIARRKYERCPTCAANTAYGNESIIELSTRLDATGLSDDVARMRKSCGLSQEELAKLVGCRRETIIRIERGERLPKADLLISIYKTLGRPIFGVSPEMLPMLERWSRRQIR